MKPNTAVDHLMWGAADLAEGMAEIRRLFEADPVPGGAHPGLGTCNALLGLASSKAAARALQMTAFRDSSEVE